MYTTITPEVIFHKFSDRLRQKTEELKYLAYMGKHFEKWLQCELVLAFKEIARPVVFDTEFKEITYDQENVCDITIEYSINGKGKNLRSDVLIAASPFLSLYTDESWQLVEQSKDAVEKCKNAYKNGKFHYVELKQINWENIRSSDTTGEIMARDLKKYSDMDWRSFKPVYNPISTIALCCVSFWDPADSSKVVSWTEMEEASENIGRIVLEKCNNLYQTDGSFLWQHVTEEICLLMVYYSS